MTGFWAGASRLSRELTLLTQLEVFTGGSADASLEPVSTITTILEPDADGSIHLPVPEEMRGGKVKVTAHLEAVSASPRPTPRFGCLAGKIRLAGDFDAPLEDFEEYMK